MCLFRAMLVFLDDQAYQEEKVNRYDSSVENQVSCGVFYVFVGFFNLGLRPIVLSVFIPGGCWTCRGPWHPWKGRDYWSQGMYFIITFFNLHNNVC